MQIICISIPCRNFPFRSVFLGMHKIGRRIRFNWIDVECAAAIAINVQPFISPLVNSFTVTASIKWLHISFCFLSRSNRQRMIVRASCKRKLYYQNSRWKCIDRPLKGCDFRHKIGKHQWWCTVIKGMLFHTGFFL